VIFVDTSFFVALLDPRDKNHARAKDAIEEFQGRRLPDQLLTTNNVVLETITVARYEAGYSSVDCLSFVVMERLGIQEALAFDSDFGHRFVLKPGPAR
jgi:predicted nucleic acid-binding protein